MSEIEYPKSSAGELLHDAKATWLGYPKGALRQYRKGTLHIREYEDKFLVHEDRADPREDPLGHLIYDAPEVLAGIAGGMIGAVLGGLAGAYLTRDKKGIVESGAAGSAALGYLFYRLAKKAE